MVGKEAGKRTGTAGSLRPVNITEERIFEFGSSSTRSVNPVTRMVNK